MHILCICYSTLSVKYVLCMYACIYVHTYTYVLMYEYMYVFRVVLTINIYYFPTQYSITFLIMCKDYVLCAVETEVCRLFVVAETQKFIRTNISKYFSPV